MKTSIEWKINMIRPYCELHIYLMKSQKTPKFHETISLTRIFFSCQPCHWHRWPQNRRFYSRISRRMRINIKKVFTHGPGAQMELFDEKTRGRKFRDTVPLNTLEI
jgi:hypothetical protein